MSLKVKCDSAIGRPICGFLLIFNSNIWPNYGPVWNKTVQNLSVIEFDLQGQIVWCN